MKAWRAACWTLILLGIPSAGRAEFDQCRLIDQVLNRLGNAMATGLTAWLTPGKLVKR